VQRNLTVETAAPTPATSERVVSFYRRYASQCATAALNAPNHKMRAELSKMVHVWREFAAEHEQMLREGRDLNLCHNHRLKGWM
jgi:hypothetical protein